MNVDSFYHMTLTYYTEITFLVITLYVHDLVMDVATLLTLNAPIATKVVCFSRLLKCLRSEQYGPRSDCSYLFSVHAVCFYT